MDNSLILQFVPRIIVETFGVAVIYPPVEE